MTKSPGYSNTPRGTAPSASTDPELFDAYEKRLVYELDGGPGVSNCEQAARLMHVNGKKKFGKSSIKSPRGKLPVTDKSPNWLDFLVMLVM